MRVTPDHRSPYKVRVWFEDQEFDQITDDLRRRGGRQAFFKGLGVDVERVLDRVD